VVRSSSYNHFYAIATVKRSGVAIALDVEKTRGFAAGLFSSC
jgi:hypothetical protein